MAVTKHHDASLDLFLRFGKKRACCGDHSLAEVYATLTGMPPKRRVAGDTALLFLSEIQERLTLIPLNEVEYLHMIEQAAQAHLTGGAIYDALLARCALKSKAETIYTWNERDFVRLPTP